MKVEIKFNKRTTCHLECQDCGRLSIIKKSHNWSINELSCPLCGSRNLLILSAN